MQVAARRSASSLAEAARTHGHVRNRVAEQAKHSGGMREVQVRVAQACRQLGVLAATFAVANGLYANLLCKWVIAPRQTPVGRQRQIRSGPHRVHRVHRVQACWKLVCMAPNLHYMPTLAEWTVRHDHNWNWTLCGEGPQQWHKAAPSATNPTTSHGDQMLPVHSEERFASRVSAARDRGCVTEVAVR